MALAISGFQVTVTYIANDSNGKSTERSKNFEIASVGVDDATKRSNARVQAEQLVGYLDAASDGAISTIRIIEIQEDAAVVIPVANLYKEAVATVALNVTGSKKGTLYLPAPNDALLNADGSSIDSAAVEWTNIEAQFKSTKYVRLSDGETMRDNDPLLRSTVRVVRSGASY